MGMRKYKRQIAKAFMIEMGVGNVNKKMSRETKGVKLWRRALQEHAQICRKVGKQGNAKRIIRKAAQA